VFRLEAYYIYKTSLDYVQRHEISIFVKIRLLKVYLVMKRNVYVNTIVYLRFSVALIINIIKRHLKIKPYICVLLYSY
jgi:hypothetical protein